jgi:hypothetical protein
MAKSDRFTTQSQQFALNQESTMTILRVIGYGLLLLALFDWVEMFYPANLMNPAWEFQTFGQLVEKVPVPLIGLGLVFYGEFNSRTQWEFPILKLLSWLTLLLAVVFFLLIPLGIGNTVRLSKQSATQITTASTQQITRTEQFEKQLSQATPEQINNLFKSQGRSLGDKNPLDVKNQLLSQVTQAKEQIKTQAKATQSLQGKALIKTSVKWNLGALVAAVLFFSIWKGTHWTRNN